MKEEKLYQVLITEENGYTEGKLIDIEEDDVIEFNPLNILSDLNNIPNSKMEQKIFAAEPIEFEELWDRNAMEFPFYKGEFAFGRLIEIPEKEIDVYGRCVNDIRKLLVRKTKTPISIYQLEILKSYLDITTEVTIISSYPIGHLFAGNKRIKKVPVSYGYYTLEQVLDESFSEKVAYFYDCYSMKDVAFSILHYLVVNGYKFVKCKHCGRYFATKSLKNQYCKRESQYKDHKGNPLSPAKTCEETVRTVQDRLRKRQRAVYKSYWQGSDSFFEFAQKSSDYLETIKKNPTIKNFTDCEKFLYEENKTLTEKRSSK